MIRESNAALDRDELSGGQAAEVLAAWQRIDQVLAFQRDAAAIPSEVLALVEQREQARKNKNWAESDRLRDEVARLGWNVKDTKDGSQLTPR
jgi:cysteinyl-tRNA synthetase